MANVSKGSGLCLRGLELAMLSASISNASQNPSAGATLQAVSIDRRQSKRYDSGALSLSITNFVALV